MQLIGQQPIVVDQIDTANTSPPVCYCFLTLGLLVCLGVDTFSTAENENANCLHSPGELEYSGLTG